MKFTNEADWDRAIRLLGGILLMYAGWGGFTSGVLSSVLTGAGGVAFLTGLAGWCPAYSIFGYATGKAKANACPHCEPAQRS